MTETSNPSNSDLPWDTFNSAEYFSHNYDTLCEEDQAILEILRDFFASNADEGMRGIDVGAGTNLYPALSMLPWCDEITLVDRSASNVAWLENEIEDFKESWDPFWDLLQKNVRYAAVPEPRKEIRRRTKVVLGDVFLLDDVRREIDTRRAEEASWEIGTQPGVDTRWEIGTMFFVACSFSSFRDEFARAVGHFLDALRPDSPFAMAYMEQSDGYVVGGQLFPAVSLTVDDVRDHLDGQVDQLTVTRVPAAKERLRPGYTGMLVAHGRTRRHLG